MVAARHWPGTVLPKQVMFHPDIPSASGGVSMSGSEQVVQSSVGRWRARLRFGIGPTHLSFNNRVLAARAMLAFMKGRANSIYIGPYDEGMSPGALAGGFATNTIGGIPHGDGSFFSDGSGYSQGRTTAVFAANAAMGDLSAQVALTPGTTPQPGHYFGIENNQLYLIDGAEYVPGGTNVWRVTFWPSLRADYHAFGIELNFDTPTCEMRMANDASGELDFSRGRRAEMTIELVEAR